jgi:hypothetical protein
MVLTDTANFRPNYHLPSDTLATLDLAFATDVTRAIVAQAATRSQQGRFRGHLAILGNPRSPTISARSGFQEAADDHLDQQEGDALRPARKALTGRGHRSRRDGPPR